MYEEFSPNATIVNTIQPRFVTTVGNSYSRAPTSLGITNLANEGVNAFISPVDNKLGKHDRVGSMLQGCNNKNKTCKQRFQTQTTPTSIQGLDEIAESFKETNCLWSRNKNALHEV